jgi:hypothetical protein
MTAYRVKVNEETPAGAEILADMEYGYYSEPAEPIRETDMRERSHLYRGLARGFRDVREIMEGKQPRVTIEEFFDELRNSGY